jgi:transmembrane sensor
MSAEIDEKAALWHLAQADDEMDWAAFAEWLEADPRHREAYDAIAMLDARIDAARPALSELLPEEAEPAPRRVSRTIRWGAFAAILIAVITVGIRPWLFDRAPDIIAYRAPAGQSREVRLSSGAVATLAPGSVLRVADSGKAPMRLDGTAFFDVRHKGGQPLVVRAGAYEIRDVGTRFEVSTGGAMVRIAVTEGLVAVRSSHVAGEVEVGAGKALLLTEPGGAVDMRPVSAGSVGAWRRGSLAYDDVPLAMVAADISRSTGRPVTIDPAVGRRRFSGVIALGERDAMVATLGELTSLETRTDGDAIRLGDGTSR